MVALTSAHQTTDTSAGPTDWIDLKNADVLSTNSTTYQSYPVSIPDSGQTYSYDAFYRFRFTGSYTNVTGVKVWISAITSSAGVRVSGAVTGTSAATSIVPVSTYSSVIKNAIAAGVTTGNIWNWHSSTDSLDLTPSDAASIDGSTVLREYSKYFVIQAGVRSTATPGDGFSATYVVEWTES